MDPPWTVLCGFLASPGPDEKTSQASLWPYLLAHFTPSYSVLDRHPFFLSQRWPHPWPHLLSSTSVTRTT
jgi:hypothetical protein